MTREDRILVTGGSGFIGGRLVEVLASRGMRIRVATSDFRHCARISRFPIELVKADLSDHGALADAVTGCSVVFHAAYRSGGTPEHERRFNLDGTRALAEAFLKAGGRRFVYFSSVTAYGEPRDGQISERSPQRPTREVYGDVKQRIEQSLRELHRNRGLAVTILQPTIVYGPYGYYFTICLLEEVRSTRIALPVGGLCNAVYVDDVVFAATLAAELDIAVGETFIVSGSSPTTWREFYGSYEKMLNREFVVELDDAQMKIEERRQRMDQSLTHQLLRALAERPEIRERFVNLPPQRWLLACARRYLPDRAKAILKGGFNSFRQFPSEAPDTSPPAFVHDGFWRALYAAKSHALIDKARRQLGYDPAYNLDEGMARTAEWARWANFLSP